MGQEILVLNAWKWNYILAGAITSDLVRLFFYGAFVLGKSRQCGEMQSLISSLLGGPTGQLIVCFCNRTNGTPLICSVSSGWALAPTSMNDWPHHWKRDLISYEFYCWVRRNVGVTIFFFTQHKRWLRKPPLFFFLNNGNLSHSIIENMLPLQRTSSTLDIHPLIFFREALWWPLEKHFL